MRYCSHVPPRANSICSGTVQSGTDLSTHQLQQVSEMVDRNSDVFSSHPSCSNVLDHEICTDAHWTFWSHGDLPMIDGSDICRTKDFADAYFDGGELPQTC